MILRIRFSLVSALLFAFQGQPEGAQAPTAPEYRVKATFLFQFTQFVDWPDQAFPASEAPLVIGILGEDPFGLFLDETVRNEKLNQHPLAIERYQRLADVGNPHVLFVSQPETGRIGEITTALKGRNILTVGEANFFADRGGMIQFVTQENRIRLRINLGAARAANLTISSRLLRPATVINAGAR
jgi:hypothetical protein